MWLLVLILLRLVCTCTFVVDEHGREVAFLWPLFVDKEKIRFDNDPALVN